MNSNRLAASLGAAFVLTASVSTAALAQAPVCSAPVKVLAQPRDGLTLLEDSKDEFKKLSGASFQIDYLNENDRRAKSRADASTVGNYNVYYVDEANVALFASSGWIVPLTDYY
ncbi:MAG: sugar ABC transporter substrate-binding protein, partial [Mesorhizobium sp.]